MLRHWLDTAQAGPPALPHARKRTADHRLSRPLLAPAGREFHRFRQRARRRTVSCATGARAQRRSRSERSGHALRGLVASLRSVVRGPAAGDRSRFLRHRRSGPTRDAHAACTWTVLVRPGLPDAGQVLLAEEGDDAHVALLIGANGATARIGYADAIDRVGRRSADADGALVSGVARAPNPTSGRVLVGQQPLDGAAVTATANRSHRALLCRLRGGACCSRRRTPRHRGIISPASWKIPRSCRRSSRRGRMPAPHLRRWRRDLLAGWDFSLGIDSAGDLRHRPAGVPRHVW